MKKKKEEKIVDFYFEVESVCKRLMDGFVAYEEYFKNDVKCPYIAPTPTMCAKIALTELNIILKEFENLVYDELPF